MVVMAARIVIYVPLEVPNEEPLSFAGPDPATRKDIRLIPVEPHTK